jgi:hypothetical protein
VPEAREVETPTPSAPVVVLREAEPVIAAPVRSVSRASLSSRQFEANHCERLAMKAALRRKA